MMELELYESGWEYLNDYLFLIIIFLMILVPLMLKVLKSLKHKINLKNQKNLITKDKETELENKNTNINDVYTLYSLALKFHENENFKKAVENYNLVIENLVENDDLLPALSMIAYASEDFSVQFNILEVYHRRGCAKMMCSDISCIDDFTQVINLNQNYEHAYYMRGYANFILHEDWQLALNDINKYLKFSPNDEDGNKLLGVLEEIRVNSLKISEFYKIAVSEFSKADKLLDFNMTDLQKEKVVCNLKNSKKNLEKALNLYVQKNRIYLYQKSHLFTLCDIYFKKLQCNLSLGSINESNDLENPIAECINIYEISKGKFNPNEDDLGASLYYSIVDKVNQVGLENLKKQFI